MNSIPLLPLSLLRRLSAPLLLTGLAASARAALLLNEVDATTAGNTAPGLAMHDSVELLNTGGGTEALTGRAIVLFRGATGNAAYDGIDLDSFSIPAGALFTAGSYATPFADVVVEYSAGFAGSPLLAGPAGATLITGDFVQDQAVTAVASASIMDALTYKPTSIAIVADTPQATLRDHLHAGFPEINEAGLLLDAPNQSISRGTPPGTARNTTTYAVGSRTPGTANDTSLPRLGFAWVTPPAGNSISENGGTLTGRITRTGSTASTITVTLLNKDQSEWSLPASVTLPAGAAEATFAASAVDDKWKDGSTTVYFHGTAGGYSPTAGWAVLTDDETAAATLAVTEVHSHVFGDANGDGTANASDQFVEIVNLSTAPQDVSGFKISNDGAEQFTFPACTVLAPGSAAVVFRGGVTVAGLPPGAPFGGAAVFTAANLSLGERGGALRLLNAASEEVAGLTYWPYHSGSNTTDTAGTVIQKRGHRLVAGATGLYSPGKKPDGSAWATPLPPVTLAFTRACLSRLEAAGTVKLEVRVPARSYSVTVCLLQQGTGLAPLADLTLDFPASGAEAIQSLDLASAGALNTDATATFSVDGTGIFTNSSAATLTVVGTQHAEQSSVLASSVIESAGGTASAFTFKLTASVTTDTPVTFSVVSGSGIVPAVSSVTIPAGTDTAVVALNAVLGSVASAQPVILQALETTTCRGIRRTVTVQDDAGLANGPFLSEVEADPLAAGLEFVEIAASAGTSLAGVTLAVFNATGGLVQTVPLTGTSSPAGFYLVHDAGLPGTGNRQTASLDLPDAGGALALYRGTAPSGLTTDNLLDAIAWGTASASVRTALLPAVTAPATLGGRPSVPAPAAASLATLARTAAPTGSGNLRQPGDWSTTAFGTPALAAGSSSFAVWAAVYGLSGDCAQFTSVNPPDADADGNPNWLEFVAGTNPSVRNAPVQWTVGGTSAAPAFSIALNPVVLADTVHFTLTPQTGTATSAFANTAWTTAPTVAAPTGIITVSPSIAGPRKFYRLHVRCTP